MGIGNNSDIAPFRYRYIAFEFIEKFGVGYSDSCTLGKIVFFKNKNNISRDSIFTNMVSVAGTTGVYGGQSEYTAANSLNTANYNIDSSGKPNVFGVNKKTAWYVNPNQTTGLYNYNVIDLGSKQDIYGYAIFSGCDAGQQGAECNPKKWRLWGSNTLEWFSTYPPNSITNKMVWEPIDRVELINFPAETNTLMLLRHSSIDFSNNNINTNYTWSNLFRANTYTPPNYKAAFLRGTGLSGLSDELTTLYPSSTSEIGDYNKGADNVQERQRDSVGHIIGGWVYGIPTALIMQEFFTFSAGRIPADVTLKTNETAPYSVGVNHIIKL